jgi:hypothetical protein
VTFGMKLTRPAGDKPAGFYMPKRSRTQYPGRITEN